MNVLFTLRGVSCDPSNQVRLDIEVLSKKQSPQPFWSRLQTWESSHAHVPAGRASTHIEHQHELLALSPVWEAFAGQEQNCE